MGQLEFPIAVHSEKKPIPNRSILRICSSVTVSNPIAENATLALNLYQIYPIAQ